MRLPDDLAAAIAEDPDDVEARLVAADWLQQHDAAHGELIALAHANVASNAARIAELEDALDPRRALASAWGIGWRAGFVERISHRGPHLYAADLAHLLDDPTSRFVRALELDDPDEHLAAALEPLADPPITLRSLAIRGAQIVRHNILNLRRIGWAHLAQLEHLVLHVHHVAPPLALPALEEAVLYLDGVNAHELRLATLPNLRRLRVITSEPDLSAFTADRFPALRHLAISAPRMALDVLRDPPLRTQLEIFETLALTVAAERDTRRFPIAGPRSEDRAVLVDVGTSPGSQPGRVTELPSGKLFRVGRVPDAGMRLVDLAPGAFVELDSAGAGWWLRNNRAGALLDHCAVSHVELRDGDELRIGQHTLRFVCTDIDATVARYRRRFGLPEL